MVNKKENITFSSEKENTSEFPEINGCKPFSENEVFWKELETIVVDGVEMSSEE